MLHNSRIAKNYWPVFFVDRIVVTFSDFPIVTQVNTHSTVGSLVNSNKLFCNANFRISPPCTKQLIKTLSVTVSGMWRARRLPFLGVHRSRFLPPLKNLALLQACAGGCVPKESKLPRHRQALTETTRELCFFVFCCVCCMVVVR